VRALLTQSAFEPSAEWYFFFYLFSIFALGKRKNRKQRKIPERT
jgi:hypothetical protein